MIKQRQCAKKFSVKDSLGSWWVPLCQTTLQRDRKMAQTRTWLKGRRERERERERADEKIVKQKRWKTIFLFQFCIKKTTLLCYFFLESWRCQFWKTLFFCYLQFGFKLMLRHNQQQQNCLYWRNFRFYSQVIELLIAFIDPDSKIGLFS